MQILRVSLALLALGSILGTGTAFAQQGPVKIGIVFSFSGGDNVEQGKEFDAAIAAYQKEHGDSAGGRKIVLIKRDDTGHRTGNRTPAHARRDRSR